MNPTRSGPNDKWWQQQKQLVIGIQFFVKKLYSNTNTECKSWYWFVIVLVVVVVVVVGVDVAPVFGWNVHKQYTSNSVTYHRRHHHHLHHPSFGININMITSQSSIIPKTRRRISSSRISSSSSIYQRHDRIGCCNDYNENDCNEVEAIQATINKMNPPSFGTISKKNVRCATTTASSTFVSSSSSSSSPSIATVILAIGIVASTAIPSAADAVTGTATVNQIMLSSSSSSSQQQQQLLSFNPIDTYLQLGYAGAMSCALTHTIVIPLDVVKTRAQTDPTIATDQDQQQDVSRIPYSRTRGKVGMMQYGKNIIEREGIQGLFLGAQATIVGYLWYGLSVYPTYTFIKQYLSYDYFASTYTISHVNEIALFAGAGAAIVASLGLTPIEAARIRVVANPVLYRPLGLFGTLRIIATENPNYGWTNLYTSLPSLLVRQVIFGSMKFLVFERTCESIFTAVPMLHDEEWTCLLVSLLAGGCSGIISSIVSQPADSILTYIAKDKQGDNNNIVDIVNRMIMSLENDNNLSSNTVSNLVTVLFRGIQSRCVWAGSIIAGQFFLYDIFRTWLHV